MGYAFTTFSKHWKLGCEEKKFHTLTADYEHSRSNRENLLLPTQMQLSKKTKNFLSCFYCIFGIYIKLWTFWKKKNEPHSLSISEIIDSEKRGYLNA